MGQPVGKGLHFFKAEAFLSDALFVGFMLALAAVTLIVEQACELNIHNTSLRLCLRLLTIKY
jgi:hypothetical protein